MTGEIRVPSAGRRPADGGPGAGPADAGSTAGSAGGVRIDERTGDVGGAAATDTVGGTATGAAATEELDALRSQLAEHTGDLQRITAEYSNYRRRVERDRQATTTFAKAQMAGELLTVLDDIERAAAHGDLSGTFKVVADKLVAGLAAQGLEPFGTLGEAFNPEVHEAVQHGTSPDVQEPTVTAVLRRGYRFGERVLRPAMVVVTDAEPPTAEGTVADDEGPAASRDAAGFSGAGRHAAGGPGTGPDAPTDGPGPAQEV